MGREGSPALACPLSWTRTLPGSPGATAAPLARPRIASLPGRAAPARSASARNRAQPRGPRAAAGGREGPPSSGTAGIRAGAQAGIPGAETGEVARGPGSQLLGPGRWRRGGGRGAGIRDPGAVTWVGEEAGPEAAGWGADLTACGEARWGPAALMEGLRNARRAAARSDERWCGPSPCTRCPEERLPWAQT